MNIHNGLKFSLECPRVQCSDRFYFLFTSMTFPTTFQRQYDYLRTIVFYIPTSNPTKTRRDFKMTWTSFIPGKINGKCNSIRKNASFSVLQETPSHSHLGVEISQDLKWDTHIVNITSSANKINGFIRRNLISCTKETKSAAYSTLVRPILEYSSSVWDPYTKEHIHQLGKIQRRAARMV